jgi:hypothetical protein
MVSHSVARRASLVPLSAGLRFRGQELGNVILKWEAPRHVIAHLIFG